MTWQKKEYFNVKEISKDFELKQKITEYISN